MSSEVEPYQPQDPRVLPKKGFNLRKLPDGRFESFCDCGKYTSAPKKTELRAWLGFIRHWGHEHKSQEGKLQDAEAEALGEESEPQVDVFLPPDQEELERLKTELREQLPFVWGIPRDEKKVESLLKSITTQMASDIQRVYTHIINMVPKAHKYHLMNILCGIYDMPMPQIPVANSIMPFQPFYPQGNPQFGQFPQMPSYPPQQPTPKQESSFMKFFMNELKEIRKEAKEDRKNQPNLLQQLQYIREGAKLIGIGDSTGETTIGLLKDGMKMADSRFEQVMDGIQVSQAQGGKGLNPNAVRYTAEELDAKDSELRGKLGRGQSVMAVENKFIESYGVLRMGGSPTPTPKSAQASNPPPKNTSKPKKGTRDASLIVDK